MASPEAPVSVELDPRAARLGGEALALGGEALEERREAAVSAVGLGQQRQPGARAPRARARRHAAPCARTQSPARRALGHPEPPLAAALTRRLRSEISAPDGSSSGTT